MKLIEINEEEFDSLSICEPYGTIFQTSKWADYLKSNECEPVYLSYLDDTNTNVALAMILISKDGLFKKKAYCQYGFLTNYFDKNLLINFHNDLKALLNTKRVKKLVIEPNVKYLNRDQTNDPVVDALKGLGYTKTNSSYYYSKQVEDKDFEINNEYLNVKQLDDSDIAKLNGVYTDRDYQKIYNCLKRYTKAYGVVVETTQNIAKLKESIESINAYIDTNPNEDIIEKVNELNNAQIDLNNLLEIENSFGANPIINCAYLVDYNGYALKLFELELNTKYSEDGKNLLTNKINNEVKALGHNSYMSYALIPNSEKIELLGEYTCDI